CSGPQHCRRDVAPLDRRRDDPNRPPPAPNRRSRPLAAPPHMLARAGSMPSRFHNRGAVPTTEASLAPEPGLEAEARYRRRLGEERFLRPDAAPARHSGPARPRRLAAGGPALLPPRATGL